MTRIQPLWWQRGIIYQIYPRSFQDVNGDGTGDLAGIIRRLDYLSDTLGVDAIWLSPFYPSPMADFGYDVSNYVDVHPVFGDLPIFDRLVDEAHRRGLAVIIDFVPNHSSDQHPWFLESRSSRDNPRRDWYVWADAEPDGSPPNNWLSVFGGGAWEWDEATGQYYLHSFLKEQPDLNWRNPEVKQAMLDVLRFWLDRGVDGFRIDVAHLIMKDPELRDNPPNPNPPAPGAPFREYDTQLHLYDKGHADVHAAFRDIRKLLDEYSVERPRMAVGEIHEFDWPVWAGYYGEKLDELHLPFNFALIFGAWTAASVRAIVDGLEAALPAGAWPDYVLGNHDVHRIATRVGPQQARLAMMLLLTLRGTPTLYYGDEIGMQDVEVPPDMVQDPFEKNVPGLGLGRDPERTPM
jgi:glycosidase